MITNKLHNYWTNYETMIKKRQCRFAKKQSNSKELNENNKEWNGTMNVVSKQRRLADTKQYFKMNSSSKLFDETMWYDKKCAN